LSEVLAELPDECHSAWNQFAAMVASQNTSGTVSESKLAGILTEILTRGKDLPAENLTYGLIAATNKPAPRAGYVVAAAAGYTPNASKPRQSSLAMSQSDLDERLQREALRG